MKLKLKEILKEGNDFDKSHKEVEKAFLEYHQAIYKFSQLLKKHKLRREHNLIGGTFTDHVKDKFHSLFRKIYSEIEI
tara:strand:- start:2624 stop:2857 length:234 start_codon:yes stop_codon:yes gene_type:complete